MPGLSICQESRLCQSAFQGDTCEILHGKCAHAVGVSASADFVRYLDTLNIFKAAARAVCCG